MCRALGVYLKYCGIGNGEVSTAIALLHIPLADRRHTPNPIRGKYVNVLSEAGLYRFIMRCDKPDARPFQDWVTRVVLPTLRKEGVYVRDEEKVAAASSVEDLDSLNDMIVGLMKRKTELLEARLAEKEAIIQQQVPKVSACTDVWQFKADLYPPRIPHQCQPIGPAVEK